MAARELLGSQGAGIGCLHGPVERPTLNYMYLRTIVTYAQLISLQWLSESPAGHFWPIRPSSMLDTTSLSALHQPFSSCKVEKFFN